MRAWVAGLAFLAATSGSAVAGDFEIMGALGYNWSPHSVATLTNSAGVEQTNTIGWDGVSFEPAPYYMARLMYWPESIGDWGFGLDYTHAKVKARRAESGVDDTYSWLEFTDGLNIVTANVFKKWDFDNARVYVGAGAGVSIPHVEIDTLPGSITGASTIREYQFGGPAVQAVAGASYEIFPGARVFGEYKISYTINDVSLGQGAGSFSTNIVNNQVLAGVSFAINDGTGF